MEMLNKFINEKLKLNKNTKLTNIKFVIWFKKFLYILLSELKDGHQYINNYTQIQHDAISLLEKINNNENYVISCFCKIESTNDFKNKISLPDLSYFDKSISKHIVEIYISILDEFDIIVEIWYGERMKFKTKNFIISFDEKNHNYIRKQFINDNWEEITDKCEEVLKLQK